MSNSNDSCTNNGSKIQLNLNEKQMDKRIESNNNLKNYEINISLHSLNYAVSQHLPSIHINCSPKLTDHQKGKDIVKALFTYIEKDFRKLNKHYIMPLGFEYWFINKNGNLTCYTRHTELFVYLCESLNYPSILLSTDISPTRPKHLPCYHTLLLKYVPNEITLDGINNELGSYISSIYNLEEMIGSITDKARHVRIEVKSIVEYDQLIQKGAITLDGRLIELQEFLAPPRILICSKCNNPGHIRKNCSLDYDSCRRCGQDRSVGDHKECSINCHRRKKDHMATDFKCPFLVEYRRSLIYQLKQKPHLLPPNLQLFIPTECRERSGRNNQFIINPISKTNNNTYNNILKNQNQQQLPFNINSHNWPTLKKQQINDNISSSSEKSIWNELKNKQMEIENLKNELDKKIQNCQLNYNENIKKLKSVLLIISAQTKYQNENIERCQTALNEFISLSSSSLNALQQLTFKHITTNMNDQNSEEHQKILQQISKSIELMQERNNLLISNKKSLNILIEQQGQLLFQAVNSLTLNDE
ncbi:unnamed protein product [Rotaria sp. Silwood2]|nr:unnamed protein product [Rotaria sp. Silwood2]CAF2956226.1 unnamed protein product [Rotaria sp. Silwood2]CAF3314655.1 unnamed protein product [Rotaria sp. Silwood2]CAF4143365.1 unnamed protein product [Rotaria sp. Silwood2]CAF4337721.1 unnamed protein product [Rotaria sp. Silwood2]